MTTAALRSLSPREERAGRESERGAFYLCDPNASSPRPSPPSCVRRRGSRPLDTSSALIRSRQLPEPSNLSSPPAELEDYSLDLFRAWTVHGGDEWIGNVSDGPFAGAKATGLTRRTQKQRNLNASALRDCARAWVARATCPSRRAGSPVEDRGLRSATNMPGCQNHPSLHSAGQVARRNRLVACATRDSALDNNPARLKN